MELWPWFIALCNAQWRLYHALLVQGTEHTHYIIWCTVPRVDIVDILILKAISRMKIPASVHSMFSILTPLPDKIVYLQHEPTEQIQSPFNMAFFTDIHSSQWQKCYWTDLHQFSILNKSSHPQCLFFWASSRLGNSVISGVFFFF